MTQDKRTGWRAALVAGDRVVVRSRSGRAVGTVGRITPGGQLVVSVDGVQQRFQPNGRVWYGRGPSSGVLERWKPEIEAKIQPD